MTDSAVRGEQTGTCLWDLKSFVIGCDHFGEALDVFLEKPGTQDRVMSA